MNTNDFGENTQLWLDRLACGELDAASRKQLLGWLDAEPLRWRACALALLESQAWNEALEDESSAESMETCGREFRRGQETRAELGQTRAELVNCAELARRAEQKRRHWGPLASLAAALLVAFTLGAFSRGWLKSGGDLAENKQPSIEKQLPGSEPESPLMATVSFHSEPGSGLPATLQLPVRQIQNLAAEPAVTPISDYDRQKWERRGYQLIKERRFIPAELPGGKKVVVPVEQVKASYVGSKVS